MAKKSTVTFEQLQQAILNRQLHPVYVLEGEETFFTDQLVDLFEKEIIPEEEQDFNLKILYGREVSAGQIIEQARQYPMFGARQVVIVKDVGQVKDLSLIAEYLKQPMPTTVLILDFKGKKLDLRTALAKNIKSVGIHFYSEKLKEYEVTQWIEQYTQKKSMTFSREAIALIQLYIGNDLNKIINELNKFEVNQFQASEIGVELVSEYIGINKEYQVLDFPDMVFLQNTSEVSRMLNYFIANPKQAAGPFIVGVFYNYISKVLLCYYNPGGNFNADRQLGIWSKHRQIAQKIPLLTMQKAMILLEDYSQKTVGIRSIATDSSELKWFTARMMDLMKRG